MFNNLFSGEADKFNLELGNKLAEGAGYSK